MFLELHAFCFDPSLFSKSNASQRSTCRQFGRSVDGEIAKVYPETFLGGGFNYFLFSPRKLGNMKPF